jgi:hypothetical protein
MTGLTTRWQLAQVNIGRARGAITDQIMQGFVARLVELNELAELSPTPHAFSFSHAFDAEGRPVARERSPEGDTCPAT